MLKRKICKMLFWCCLFIVAKVNAYIYDPNEFATEVIEYIQGSAIPIDWFAEKEFNEPNVALGRPTIDTTGDGFYLPDANIAPVLPINQAYRFFELVTVGIDGRLTLKFNHPVQNNPANPYGIDFIIFGNSFLDYSTIPFTYINPSDIMISSEYGMWHERGLVSVSKDGLTWYTFSQGPFADGFAPTLGRVYNPDNPDANLGSWNHWWSQPTNPTLPLDPTLTVQDFDQLTLTQVCQMYGESAGGTGFDIGLLGLDWIKYVRIEHDPYQGGTPEIDAISDAGLGGSGAGSSYILGDFNEDGRVDFVDFAKLAKDWNAGIDWKDMDNLVKNWLVCNQNCQ
jgi:hypothetical protein